MLYFFQFLFCYECIRELLSQHDPKERHILSGFDTFNNAAYGKYVMKKVGRQNSCLLGI